MNSIYILLIALLLYTFFGTIVNVLVASGSPAQLRRIRTKIFFRTFAAPILFGLAVWFVILTGIKVINIGFGVGIFIGALIRAIFGERRYLANFKLESTSLEIQYLTSLLKLKTYSFELADLSGLQIEKANWLIDYPASLSIKYKDEWMKFYLLDKKLKSTVKGEIEAVDKSISIVGQDLRR